jgi:hypothetical protein
MFSSPLGIITSVIVGIVMIVFIFVIITGVLAFTGGPSACTPGGTAPIENNDANAAAFDAKWDEMDLSLDGGTAASATFTESEVTSRANRFIEDEGGDIADVQVCIYDGSGAATGEVDLPIGNAKFKVTGTVDLTGEHPEAQFDDIELGNIPGVIMDPFESAVEDAIQELLDDINLDHTYTVELKPGEAVVSGTPSTP